MAGRRSSAASFVLLSAATLLLALASSRSPFVTAQDSSSSSSSSPSTSGCILPFDVDEVPATAGGLVTSPDGSKQELSLGASALGKLSLSGRLALALPGAAACPGDGKALLEALPGAKLIDVEGATGLRISPNPVKAKVREREEESRKEREREKRERERKLRLRRPPINLVCGGDCDLLSQSDLYCPASPPPKKKKNFLPSRSLPSPTPSTSS